MDIPRLYWPYKGMGILDKAQALDHLVITQLFGANPQDYVKYGFPGHDGLDLVGRSTKAITPVWYGTVKEKTYASTGYGYHLIIDHEGVLGYYAHASELHVKSGDKVNPETVIMQEDSTGNSSGSHLHLGIRIPSLAAQPYKGFVDPLPYLTSDASSQQVPSQPSELSEFYPLPIMAIATASPHLNIRLLPHSKSMDIGDIYPNQEVEVQEIVEGKDGLVWARIKVDAYAWVEYLHPKQDPGG